MKDDLKAAKEAANRITEETGVPVSVVRNKRGVVVFSVPHPTGRFNEFIGDEKRAKNLARIRAARIGIEGV